MDERFLLIMFPDAAVVRSEIAAVQRDELEIVVHLRAGSTLRIVPPGNLMDVWDKLLAVLAERP